MQEQVRPAPALKSQVTYRGGSFVQDNDVGLLITSSIPGAQSYNFAELSR